MNYEERAFNAENECERLREDLAVAQNNADNWRVQCDDLQADLAAARKRLKAIVYWTQWDGYGLWMPDWCIKLAEPHGDVEAPTVEEFEEFLDSWVKKMEEDPLCKGLMEDRKRMGK